MRFCMPFIAYIITHKGAIFDSCFTPFRDNVIIKSMKKLIPVILIVIVIFGIWNYLDKINQPASPTLTDKERKQALSKILKREAVLATNKNANGSINYSSRYISFSYPAAADVHKVDILPPLLENFQFGIRSPQVKISILVAETQSPNNLSEYPAVTLRQSQKDIYKQTTKVIDGNSGLEFIKKTDMVEKSSFFLHKGLVYSIVATGFDMRDTDDLYTKTFSSMKFN